MPISDGPRAPAGYVSDTALYGDVITDLTESIPALAWPENVITYAAMRNDTQIAAILSSYTLPLRAATWAVDPKGCRDEVVQMCADAYGMPIVGDDESGTGPFRRRGVLWDEHLDVALDMLIYGRTPGGAEAGPAPFPRGGVLGDEPLDVPLDMLIYGHMPFAIGGEVTGKPLQWHLTTLSERMPSTIIKIEVNKDGSLKSITQFGGDSDPIPASNLLWYAHRKRGGNWAGRSMLREAYAPWLIKHEIWRVLATS